MAVSKIITSSISDDTVTSAKIEDNVTIAGTSHLGIPSGTTAQRPGSPSAGNTRFNSTIGSLEFYDGTNWLSTNVVPTINSITGTIYAGASSTLTLSITNTTDTISVKYFEGNTLLATDTDRTVSNNSATSTVPSAVYGQTAGDTISIQVINSDGTPSSNNIDKTVIGLPTGGVNSDGSSRAAVTSGGYRYHAFLTSASNGFVIPSNFPTATMEALIIAGGGAGAGDNNTNFGNGGGGAGGVKLQSSISMTPGSYNVVVGAGGAGGATAGHQVNGNASEFASTYSAAHGGGGGYYANQPGANGGSGGGGGADSGSGGAGTSGQGNNGASGASGRGGGGGGAGSAGSGANGGDGTNTYSAWATATSTGVSGYYAGGGGGSIQGGTGGTGGAGGGGAGGTNGVSGTANTGSGGGAQISGGTTGGGGKGIIIIRYQLP